VLCAITLPALASLMAFVVMALVSAQPAHRVACAKSHLTGMDCVMLFLTRPSLVTMVVIAVRLLV